MKTKLLALLILSFLVSSCGRNDKISRLENLKSERDKLTEKIRKLEKEIEKEGKNNPGTRESVLVKIEEIETVEFKHYIEVQGNTESDYNVFVPAETGGIVKKIYVEEGDRVSKGQLLAELDGAIYEKGIEELQTSLDLATTVYERQKRLWDQKIGSEMQYLQAKNQKESLEKRLETTREQYQLTKIKSPLSGTVDEIAVKEGEAAVPGLGAIRVVKLTSLKISAEVSEAYISDIKKKDRVRVSIPSINKTFFQDIHAVSQVINPENRTFSFELKVPSAEKDIKPNMLAKLLVNDYTSENAVIIPLNVIQHTGEEYFVFVAIKEKDHWVAKKKKVSIGKYYDNKIEILKGIEPGDRVIITGFQKLADGQVVSIGEK